VHAPVHRLSDLVSSLPRSAAPRWSLDEAAGRLVEISGAGASANLTAAFGLVLEAQRRSEPVAWVTSRNSTFYPPDAAESGVDLETLAVVRAPDSPAAVRSAGELTRSGAFGLVVVDLGPKTLDSDYARIPAPLQTRLAGLAQKHATAVVVLTEKTAEAPSLGSLVSLRAEAIRGPAFFPCEVVLRILKDKRRGPGDGLRETCHGPAGLC
jgi:recombination protein RecA